MRRRTYASDQAGFTIVELMIATLVFSMVLMVIIYGVLNFSHAYFSGVNSSATQNTARTVINNIAQAIEFSGNTITPTSPVIGKLNTFYFCAGNATYYYVQGMMYDGATPTAADPGLFRQPGSCTSSPSFSAAAGGEELLGTNMRIPYFKVAQADATGRLYSVALSVAFGDSDLLCNVSKGSAQGGCQLSAPLNPIGQPVIGAGSNPLGDVECRQVTGSQFCAHAALATTVSLRVTNNELAP